MMFQRLLILFLLTFLTVVLTLGSRGQTPCTVLGQTPPTAFPVCGTAAFKQDVVPLCGGYTVPMPGCGPGFTDVNPFYYKFTCFAAGTLGFSITPVTVTDDYDWQIFDVTGHDPNDIYTDASLFVSGNWSHLDHSTGTGDNNNGSVNCGGNGYPNMNTRPNLIKGHDYLMLISHFDNTQSGYSLVFSGGTASITDSTPPLIKEATPICLGDNIRIVLNKKMKCSSLDTKGGDFTVSSLPPGVTVTSAYANSCSSGFDLDTLMLSLSGTLPAGTYNVTAVNSKIDGNTLLDNCGNQIPENQTIPFTLVLPTPTLLDSLTPPACAPNQIQLVFKKGIQCSSIEPDGSDFTITGTAPVAISGITTNCDAGGLTHTILVNLSAPIMRAGNFLLTLKPGPDGNTFYDECGLETPSSSLRFSTGDTVNAAAFTDILTLGCKMDTVEFSYPSQDGVSYWRWVFDGSDTSRSQTPRRSWSSLSTHSFQLIVSNGFCSDTTKGTMNFDNMIQAAFEAPNILCPTDYALFKNNSKGPIDAYTWDFADGTTSNLSTPTDHLFPPTGIETNYMVRLIASNSGCSDTAFQKVDVLRSCYIAVPTAFTPNGDGLNDYLYPLNAFKADNLVFQVYNRQGQLVFESHDWTQKWDGRMHGHSAPAGTYAWFLQYTDRDSKKAFFQKGTSVLIR